METALLKSALPSFTRFTVIFSLGMVMLQRQIYIMIAQQCILKDSS
jgi:hypothetical protein